MWHAAKDHLKINEGEGKEIYGSIDKWPKSPPLQGGVTGSNPVGATIKAYTAIFSYEKFLTHLVE